MPGHRYVWQRKDWPKWRWDDSRLIGPLAGARLGHGRLLGKVAALAFDLGHELRAEILAEETIQTAAILFNRHGAVESQCPCKGEG